MADLADGGEGFPRGGHACPARRGYATWTESDADGAARRPARSVDASRGRELFFGPWTEYPILKVGPRSPLLRRSLDNGHRAPGDIACAQNEPNSVDGRGPSPSVKTTFATSPRLQCYRGFSDRSGSTGTTMRPSATFTPSQNN